MNVLLDDLVDGIFHEVHDSLVPKIEAVSKKVSEELKNRRQTPPSSVDLLYLTDRLIVSSQPITSSDPSYVDTGRDERRSHVRFATPTVGPQPLNPPDSDDNNNSKKEANAQESFLENIENLNHEEVSPLQSLKTTAKETHEGITNPIGCGEKYADNNIENTRSSFDKSDASISKARSGDEIRNGALGDENIDRNVNGGKVQFSTGWEGAHRQKDQQSSPAPPSIKNSPGIVTSFLDKRHGRDHYLAFSLTDEQPDDRTLLLFRRQIVQLGWWSPCTERSETPSIPNLLKICYAIHAYLQINPENVALVYCSNGKTRTAIAVACYLKFVGVVKCSQDGFSHFLSKRGIQNPEATWKQLPPSLRLFFHQFDTALSVGGYLNRKPMLLRAIVLQGVPVEEKPCLDIWNSSQRHVYSSHPDLWNENVKGDNDSSASSLWIGEDGFYKVNVPLEGDFLILCGFGGDFAKETTVHDPSKIIFRYTNTTGFLAGGCPHELQADKVDLTRRYAAHLDHEDFIVTLLFQADWEEAETRTERVEHHKVTSGKLSERVWRSHDRRACEEGLKVIFQHHSARPNAFDIGDFRTLNTEATVKECAGHLICLALQLSNFDYGKTNQLLLGSSSFSCSRLQQKRDVSGDKSPVSTEAMQREEEGSSRESKKTSNEAERLQKMFGILDTINVSQNLNPTDIAEFEDLNARRDFPSAKMDSQSTPKRRNSAIESKRYAAVEACSNDVGWMVPAMAYPRPGDIVRCFGAEYAPPKSRFPALANKAMSMPIVPYFPNVNSTLRRQQRNAVYDKQRIHPFRQHIQKREKISTQVLLKMQHTGLTLPCLVNLLNDSQEWGAIPSIDGLKSEVEKGHSDGAADAVSESIERSMNRKSKEQKEQEWKNACKAEEKEKSRKKGAKDQNEKEIREQSPSREEETTLPLVPLKEDPEYAKYFKMLKIGMPLEQVQHAMKREAKDPLVLKLDPNKSLEEQIPEQPENGDVALKEDPEYEKYFKMLKVGLPKDAVKNALVKDGKDPSIMDLDPTKSLNSQQSKNSCNEGLPLQDDPEYEKYYKMLKMGLPKDAVKNALMRDGKDPSIIDLDPTKSLKSQVTSSKDTGIPLKDDPEYAKYFKMIAMGLPIDAVKNAMMRDGKDPNILDLDPEKSVKFQLGKNENEDTGIPFKEDPEYAKYFKMLGMGLPRGAVKNALERDGKDPNMLDLDPEKSVAYQQKQSATLKKSTAKKKKRMRRKKIYWNPIDPGKVKEDSMWHIVRDDVRMSKLNYDQKEFEELFTESAEPKDKKKNKPKKEAKKLVQVIDPKRSMNGGIILARLRIEYSKIADIVNKMERSKFDSTQLLALKEFLADADERRGLIGYMQKSKTPKDVLYADLSETEKYMYTMIDVANVSEKMDAMLFRCMFKNRFDDINAGITVLNTACDQLRSSKKLRKLMAMILTVVNEINTGGEGNMAIGFTIDALLKLNEAKAFDKKTSVLHYVVKLVKKNDEKLLTFSNDINSVIPAESVLLDALATEVKALGEELVEVHKTVQTEAERLEEAGELKPMTLEDLREQKTTVRQVGQVSQFNKMDHHTGRTSMERFTLNSRNSCDQAISSIDDVKKKYLALLNYFGEDEKMATVDFFGILRRFMTEFRKAAEQVEAIEKKEAKERKREAAKAAKAAKAATRNGEKTKGEIKKGGRRTKPTLSVTEQGSLQKKEHAEDVANEMPNRHYFGNKQEWKLKSKQRTRSDLLSAMAAAAASRKSSHLGKNIQTTSQGGKLSSRSSLERSSVEMEDVTPIENTERKKEQQGYQEMNQIRSVTCRTDTLKVASPLGFEPIEPVQPSDKETEQTRQAEPTKVTQNTAATVSPNNKPGQLVHKEQASNISTRLTLPDQVEEIKNGKERNVEENKAALLFTSKDGLTKTANIAENLTNLKQSEFVLRHSTDSMVDEEEKLRDSLKAPVATEDNCASQDQVQPAFWSKQGRQQSVEIVMKKPIHNIAQADLLAKLPPEEDRKAETVHIKTKESLTSKSLTSSHEDTSPKDDHRVLAHKMVTKLDDVNFPLSETNNPLADNNDPQSCQAAGTSKESQAPTETLDNMSVSESIHKRTLEVRMSKTWTDGEEITNWMPWADQVIKACDTDSVVNFEVPRDLNDGMDFDDDSTIISTMSFASCFDDLSVVSASNTPGRVALPHTNGKQAVRPPTSPFVPDFVDAEQFPAQFVGNVSGQITTPLQFAASTYFDDSRSPSTNIVGPPYQLFDPAKLSGGNSSHRDEVGLHSGLSFGADIALDGGLGGFGSISDMDNVDNNGIKDIKEDADKKKSAWFPWGKKP